MEPSGDGSYKDLLASLELASRGYDLSSKIFTLCLEERLRWSAIEGLGPGRILDVGSGTGAMARLAASRFGGSYVVALEPLGSFIDALKRVRGGVEIVQGFVENAPFRRGSFDFSIASFMLRDVQSLPRALAMIRILTRRRIAILDFWRPGSIALLLLEIAYILLTIPLALVASPRSLRGFLWMVRTLFRVPRLEDLLKILAKLGDLDTRCWAGCVLFKAHIDLPHSEDRPPRGWARPQHMPKL